MPPCPITIVGAGLTGLTLGHCLKQFGIAAVVLERAPSPLRNNYTITLHPWAFQPLLSILKVNEELFREKLAIDLIRQGHGEISDGAIAPGIPTDAGSSRCHRGRLERLLREGQDIRWDHTVQDVTTSPQGIVVQLKDANPLNTDVLIGADGVHSQVRKSLAPKIELKVLPFVVFNGKRQFTKAEYQDLFSPKLSNQVMVHSRHKDIILETSINDYTSEHVDISYTYSRPARKSDPLHRPDRPISGAADIPDEFYKELEDLKDLRPPFDIIFNSAEVRKDRVLHWLMRSSLGGPAEIDHLAKRGVLLVGDAVHAMPILGGEGANNAIKDGVDLAQHISNHGTGSLQDFANKKYETWRSGVVESEKRLAEMHGQTKASL
ncbi:MAG: hypothetical protein Q9216_006392 [Gyalolechia sp. 2 TL-2023]